MRKPLVALSLAVGASLSVVQAAGTMAAPSGSSPQSSPHAIPASAPPASPASPTGVSGAQIVATAMKYLGYPYTATGNSPSTGFSCIGFASYVYRQNGIALPGDLPDALAFAPQVSFSQLEPGDLLFFRNTIQLGYAGGLSHVAIYIGNGEMIHAEWYNRGVVITHFQNDPVDYNYWPAHYMTANRPWTGASVPVQAPTSPAAPGGTTSSSHPTISPSGPAAIVHAASGVNLRRKPSMSAGIIQVLARGTTVYVIGHSGNWDKVELTDGTVGYVISSALDSGATRSSNPVAPSSAGTPRATRRSVASTVSGLNVRSAPSTGSRVVGSAAKGQHLEVLGYKNGWYKVRLPNGQIGWVSGAYVRGGGHSTRATTVTRRKSGSRHGRTASVAVNVRSGPSIRDSIIAGIPVGGSYQIIGWSHGWARVRLPNGTTGWVDGAVIGGGSSGYGDRTSSSTHRGARRATRRFAHLITAGVRIHARPGVRSRVIGLVAQGTHVQVWKRWGNWDRVHTPSGMTGWVLGIYVR